MVKKSSKQEDAMIAKLSNIWEFLAYALKYRTKEIMGGIIVILLAVIVFYLIATTGYNKKEGLHKKATETKVEVSK